MSGDDDRDDIRAFESLKASLQSERLGRLHQSTVRRRRQRPRLPRALHPQKRHLQSPPRRLRRRTGAVPMARLRPRQQGQGHDPRRRRVHPPIPPARAPARLHSAAPLRDCSAIGHGLESSPCAEPLLAQPIPEPREPESPQAMMLCLTGIDITVCRQCGRGTLASDSRPRIAVSMRQRLCRPARPLHDDSPQPTSAMPSSATRPERALLRQRHPNPDESHRRELPVTIGTLRRHRPRPVSHRLGVVVTGKLS